MLNKLMDFLFGMTRHQKTVIIYLIDFASISVAYLFAYIVTNDLILSMENISITHFVLTSLFSLLTYTIIGFYKSVTRFISFKILFFVAVGSILSGLWGRGLLSLLSDVTFTGSHTIIFIAFQCIIIGAFRLSVRSYFSYRLNTEKKKVLIYGAGAAGQQLALSLANGKEFYPVAFMDDDLTIHNTYIQDIKVYAPHQLKKLATYYKPEKVLLALPSISKSERKKIISAIGESELPVQTIPGIKDIVEGKMKIDEFQDVEIDDLLGRDSVPPHQDLLESNVKNKTVMVTGAGGSIGSELCRQIIKHQPQQLLLFEVSEYALYVIDKELNELNNNPSNLLIKPFLGTVQNENRLKNILRVFKVDTLYHAAAYKHVPMVEYNVIEGVRNNVFGTLNTANAAIEEGVDNFVLISTDKAVRPTNVMGATKRMAELVLQALAKTDIKTKFSMVRFGNVLGSSGSVVPLFKKQIKQGGPITVTHPDIIRYFMTIPEAAQLVIQAGAMGKGGDVFVLDMGEPIKIADLAKKIIRLMGLEEKTEENPHGDIRVEYTGLRPGEKLFEELLIGDNVEGTSHPRIMTANEASLSWEEIEDLIQHLDNACFNFEHQVIRNILLNAPTGFNPSDGICDLVWSADNNDNVLVFPESKKHVD